MRALEDTQDEQFVRTASSISNAKALFEFLVGSSQVAALTKALFEGDVKVTQIDEFVRKLLQDFRQGRIFVWDVSIASIAVAIRSYPGRFATDFLDELGALQIQEIPLAPRVASYARKARAESVAVVSSRDFTFARPNPDVRLVTLVWLGNPRSTENQWRSVRFGRVMPHGRRQEISDLETSDDLRFESPATTEYHVARHASS